MNRIVAKSNTEMADKMAAAKKNWISEVRSEWCDGTSLLSDARWSPQ